MGQPGIAFGEARCIDALLDWIESLFAMTPIQRALFCLTSMIAVCDVVDLILGIRNPVSTGLISFIVLSLFYVRFSSLRREGSR